MIELQIYAITYSQVQTGAYALILAEKDGKRRVPIVVGTPEAQSIAIFLEGMQPPRPLTHDLFFNLLNALEIKMLYANIYDYKEGLFLTQMTFDTGEEELTMEARTSDAIAIALRFGAPIYTTEKIMQEVAVQVAAGEANDAPKDPASAYERMNAEELQKALHEAITNEDYEKAALLRDVIKRKS